MNCNFNDQQLQKKFKHAREFGITGPFNPTNALAFKHAIINHLNDANTKRIIGTHRGESVEHFFNSITKLNVMCKDYQFWSAWRLSPKQESHLLTDGNVI